MAAQVSKVITREQAMAILAAKQPAKAAPQAVGGVRAVMAKDGSKVLIEAAISTQPVITSGQRKDGSTWVQCVHASTIRSAFAKSVKLEHGGKVYRVQVKVTEDLDASGGE